MKIRTKIAIQFTAIIAVALAIFAVSFYYLFRQNHREEFNKRLTERAEATATLLTERNDLKRRLKVFDRRTLSKNFRERVSIFRKEKKNDEDKVVYASFDADTIHYNAALLNKVRESGHAEASSGDTTIVVGMIYKHPKKDEQWVVMATADDHLGNEQLQKLRTSLITGFLVAILGTIILGFVFAGQALRPISEMNEEISSITAYNLKKQLNEGNKQDEIAKLAINFNQMLNRLQQSFELQRSFVSNASHELRTPLAALTSEIQVALEQERTPDEHRKVLQSLLADAQRLNQLTNGLLQLARSENKAEGVKIAPLRLDELLFETQAELQAQRAEYQIVIDFDDIPESDQSVTVQGNTPLLKTVFNNLIDNACKYSFNKRAEVRIAFDDKDCIVRVLDTGIGIPEAEQKRIFEPLYRAQNATAFRGSGIGLSVCRRIVDLHSGTIDVQSTMGQGSVFTVTLPNLIKS